MGLSIEAKLLWLYLCDNCDNAGVIDFNAKLAAVQIGQPIEENHFAELKDRIQRLPNQKIWVPKFVKFQFGTLSPNCKPHASVLSLIESHHLNDTAIKPYVKGIHTLQEKEEREDKVQEEEKEKDRKGVQGETNLRRAVSVEEVIEKGKFVGVSETDCRKWFADCEACGWRRGDGTLFDNWPKQLCIHRDKEKNAKYEKAKPTRLRETEEVINVKRL